MMSEVNSLHSHAKVYIGIVHQLREMISKDGLKPGDKIPSERELSERLNVGRSSVREALRALELLGLIETKRGEGTFLRDFRDHHLIDLLGMFILEDHKAQEDILYTKMMIEKEALKDLFSEKKKMDALFKKVSEAENLDDVFRDIVMMNANHLAQRIWNILNDFETLICGEIKITERMREEITRMLQGIENQDKETVQEKYKRVREIVDNDATISNIFF
ncbi:FadR/GntR family transcriptional regulator [Rossellomorea aquimaris]|uniref:FadR family transcriptional regulator n=2 Tax=Rossellomorea aquimaris TaxID=189382 RepID=A0A5D4TSD6_9BACI|nr:GntR family transcriptional regulator [Rossellomorea aquimaris]TYS77909.1 FadR family transcriptional regulator [Rossellomorea aquimaris]TYS87092.1 FadR family transcriptional regulator [Rossellomorea aquimaris]